MQSRSLSRSFKPGLIGASPITDAKWPNASCPRSSDRSERHPAKVQAAGATPAADAIFAPVVLYRKVMHFGQSFYAAILVSCSTSAFLAAKSAVTVVRP